jgi:hypothetical protein
VPLICHNIPEGYEIMKNQSEIIENFDGSLIGFLEKFLNLFLVEGVSVEAQQLIKISILFITILLIVLFFVIVFKFLKIWIESMQRHPEYIFFIIMTVLVFSFAGDFSFGGACLAIFFFLLLGHIFKLISKHKSKIVEALTRIDFLETIKNLPDIRFKEMVKEQ